MLAKFVPIKKIERTNVVVVYLQQQIGFVPKYDPYAINVEEIAIVVDDLNI